MELALHWLWGMHLVVALKFHGLLHTFIAYLFSSQNSTRWPVPICVQHTTEVVVLKFTSLIVLLMFLREQC
jgi:hypothetical protein